jgi:Putative Ig domain/Immunoglobulin I-set domain
MAVQGQSFFQASGDGDSWVNTVLSFNPASGVEDDPYVTSVGGTTLTMNGSGASYASERVWNDGNVAPGWNGSGYVGNGGGISASYTIPSWQKGLDMSANRGSTTRRNFPDVAMVAENLLLVSGGLTNAVWGTSCAAPLWAGFMALVNQEAAANSQPAVGFLNPALYALGQSPDYTNNFNDITVGNNATPTSGGLYPAVPGYDLCTGWGSPKGSNLIHSLALPQRLVIAPNSNPLFTGPVGGPFNPGALGYSLTNGNGFSPRTSSLDWSLGLDAAWLSVSLTNGTLLTNGPAESVTVTPNLLATNLAAGSYTATLYFTNSLDQSVQTRHITFAIVTLPLITSQPTNQAVLEGMTTAFSVGTATNALLYYQWQFDSAGGPTNLTDSGGIFGSATSSLTIKNVSPGNVGAYSVMVSNAAGPVTSTNAFLKLITGQAPVIVSAPASQTLLPGATATFTVSAAGDQPLSYFWQTNGTNLTDGSGGGLVFRIILPLFLSNPFTQASAHATAPYSASLVTNAVTPAGDVLTFAKVSGPAWLAVATDGTLSGTPALADIGANVFTVSLADTNGWSSTATMTITLVPAPLLASLSVSQGTNLVLNWGGGQPPYSVQMATNLTSAVWQTIAGPMTNTTLLVTPSNAAAFYRIQVQ